MMHQKLVENFEVFGYFYSMPSTKPGEKINCRKYLDIKRKGSSLSEPDIMVVMMNPGSSYPLDGIEDKNAPSKANPDPTQNQIMAVMNKTGFNFARILNLSDVRQPSSSKFYDFLKSSPQLIPHHSIFDESRQEEFKILFRKDVPVIYGWGVNYNLKGLACQAITRINENKPIGIRKDEVEWAYYHPLPRVRNKQHEWVDEISKLLLNVQHSV